MRDWMKNNPVLVTLLCIMLFDHTALNIAFPVLTLLFFDEKSSLFSPQTEHSIRSMWYGLSVAVPHILNIFITPLLSGLSDEYGRKPILMIGTFGAFLFALVGAIGILFGSLILVMLALIIRGAFSRTNPIAQAIIGDKVVSNQKMTAMGYLQTAISIGAFLGPLIGGYFANRFLFNYFNYSLPYFIASIFGGISLLMTLFLFNETLTIKKIGQGFQFFNFQAIRKISFNKKVLFISIVLLLTQMSWSLYYQFIPPILKTELSFSPSQLGLYVGMIAFWLALATAFGIKFINQFLNFYQMLMLSLYLILVGLLLTLLFLFYHASFLIWIAAVPTAMGDVIVYSALITLYSDAVESHEQGKVMGICFVIVALIWALTGLVGGYLMGHANTLPLMLAPIGILFAIGVCHFNFFKAALYEELRG